MYLPADAYLFHPPPESCFFGPLIFIMLAINLASYKRSSVKCDFYLNCELLTTHLSEDLPDRHQPVNKALLRFPPCLLYIWHRNRLLLKRDSNLLIVFFLFRWRKELFTYKCLTHTKKKKPLKSMTAPFGTASVTMTEWCPKSTVWVSATRLADELRTFNKLSTVRLGSYHYSVLAFSTGVSQDCVLCYTPMTVHQSVCRQHYCSRIDL